MTHCDVYFPLADTLGAGARLWASANQFERMRQPCPDTYGRPACAYQDGSVEFKEGGQIADNFPHAGRDDARIAACPLSMCGGDKRALRALERRGIGGESIQASRSARGSRI